MTKKGRVQSDDIIEVPGVGTFKITPSSEAAINLALSEVEERTVLLEPAQGGEAVSINLHIVVNAVLMYGGLRRPGRNTGEAE